ncbi:MAG: hypothetical protein EBQ92_02245 [Proteobacteria bacterium]|nr:hypothetical protein [Pseudomonadota bacterium]
MIEVVVVNGLVCLDKVHSSPQHLQNAVCRGNAAERHHARVAPFDINVRQKFLYLPVTHSVCHPQVGGLGIGLGVGVGGRTENGPTRGINRRHCKQKPHCLGVDGAVNQLHELGVTLNAPQLLRLDSKKRREKHWIHKSLHGHARQKLDHLVQMFVQALVIALVVNDLALAHRQHAAH